MDCSGLGVALATPFKADGSLDEPALRRLIRHLLENKVDYLVALGTTGEAVTQSLRERIRLLEIVFEEVGDKLPVIVGAGGYDTHLIAEEMRLYAQHFPLQAFLSVTPYYNKPTAEGLYAHYAYLAERSPHPIVLYNVPVRTGVHLPPAITLRLARDFPGQIIGLKDASLDLIQGMELYAQIPQGFQLISGDDVLAAPAILMGYVGVISVLGNALPHLMKRLVDAALEGDRFIVRELESKLLPLMRLCFAEGNPTGIKGLLAELNLIEPWTRLPLLPASEQLRSRFREALIQLGAAYPLEQIQLKSLREPTKEEV
ncbi:MAG: 4-hydroxy-tetrahydrodipicolinate synthase [Bacteroidia bacterium]|nr:4-hydroxy-tetrahydrodipicolinate synthase [Bacteroidia bacterium]MCX7764038.1 4-hydroxy-tetrahydrodipicolinate synthase [Bacteroidia bacterium]MDW8057067.1 4-hydroxy-tetrahydrodipicolinate synthase [Bacteroidia bacterium]